MDVDEAIEGLWDLYGTASGLGSGWWRDVRFRVVALRLHAVLRLQA